MSESLFKGKRSDNGEWIYGDLRHWRNGSVGIHNNILSHTLTVDPETVGRFTGLYDKNSRPIYEGDYILAVLPATTVQREFVWPVMPVVYSRGAFGLADSHGEVTPLCGFAPYVTFEVVGNIYDTECRSDMQQEATEQ